MQAKAQDISLLKMVKQSPSKIKQRPLWNNAKVNGPKLAQQSRASNILSDSLRVVKGGP